MRVSQSFALALAALLCGGASAQESAPIRAVTAQPVDAPTPDQVQQRAGATQAELPRAPGEGDLDPGMEHFGAARQSGREASEDLTLEQAPSFKCPAGQAPVLHQGQQVLGLDGEPMCKAPRQFLKGELTNLGSAKLTVKDSRFGLRLGYARLDGSSYLAVTPEVDMRFGKFAFGLGVPLNFRAYANGFVDQSKVVLRAHDYDKPSDFARVLRFLTYGAKEDNLYVNVSQLFAASIGHGSIVRRYSGNVDQNITRVGAQLDAYGRFGGFEAFIGDVVQPTHFMAGLAFVKPLGFISGPLLNTLGQTSLGVSTAMDLHAPYTLKRIPGGYPEVGDDGEPNVAVDRRAQLVGVDLETKIVKTEGADIKPFLDYSRLLGIQDEQGKQLDGGGGLTLGILGRFNAGEVKVHAFRLIVEGRYYDANYIPGYFDTFYEVQKYQFVTNRASVDYQPKLRTILERDPGQKRGGYYAEAAYQYNGGLALMASFEDSFKVSGLATICPAAPASGGPAPYCNNPDIGSRNFTLHVEYPAYSWLQFFASFYRRSFGGLPFDPDHPLGDNTLIYGAFRLHILPILFLNARVYRSWQADPVLGEMRNVTGFDADLEFGYEFDRRKR